MEEGYLILICLSYYEQGLISKYGGSIQLLLEAVYPSSDWSGALSKNRRSSEEVKQIMIRILNQQHLEGLLKGVFAREKVLVRHRNHNV